MTDLLHPGMYQVSKNHLPLKIDTPSCNLHFKLLEESAAISVLTVTLLNYLQGGTSIRE